MNIDRELQEMVSKSHSELDIPWFENYFKYLLDEVEKAKKIQERITQISDKLRSRQEESQLQKLMNEIVIKGGVGSIMTDSKPRALLVKELEQLSKTISDAQDEIDDIIKTANRDFNDVDPFQEEKKNI